MSKTVKVVVALALALALAVPAMAEMKLNGYYRLQGNAESFNRAPGSEQNTASFIDNRLRFKLTNPLNDFITVVYYMEVDTPWGELGRASTGGGNGGKISADGVNVETKNAYVDFKVPDTSWTVRTGIQGWGVGNAFESMVVDDDMAGLNLTGNAGPVKLDLMYSKWDEGDRVLWDDVDMYAGMATFKANENLTLTGLAMWLDANSPSSVLPNIFGDTVANAGVTQGDDYYFGINADARIAEFGVEGFFLYRTGTFEFGPGVPDTDISSWVFDLKGRAVIPMGDVKVHFAYFGEQDDDIINDINADAQVFSPAKGGFEYHNDNLMLFLTDVYYNNGSQGAIALSDAAYNGYGLWFLTVSGNVKMPSNYYAKYGVGYFSAVEDTVGGEPATRVKGEDLGFEVAAQVGKKFAEKYDLSLRGAYGVLGDFYGSQTAGVSDPDDIYKVVAQLNVGF